MFETPEVVQGNGETWCHRSRRLPAVGDKLLTTLLSSITYVCHSQYTISDFFTTDDNKNNNDKIDVIIK